MLTLAGKHGCNKTCRTSRCTPHPVPHPWTACASTGATSSTKSLAQHCRSRPMRTRFICLAGFQTSEIPSTGLCDVGYHVVPHDLMGFESLCIRAHALDKSIATPAESSSGLTVEGCQPLASRMFTILGRARYCGLGLSRSSAVGSSEVCLSLRLVRVLSRLSKTCRPRVLM